MTNPIDTSINTLVPTTGTHGSSTPSPAVEQGSEMSAPVIRKDTITLTGDAMELSEMKQHPSANSFDVKKVEAIRRELAEGTYSIDNDRIAAKLLDIDDQLG